MIPARDPNASRLAAILPLQFIEFLLKLRDAAELGLKIAPALTKFVGKFSIDQLKLTPKVVDDFGP